MSAVVAEKLDTAKTRLTARVEEQYDDQGDLVWALTLLAHTYDRHALDVIAAAIGCELEFLRVV